MQYITFIIYYFDQKLHFPAKPKKLQFPVKTKKFIFTPNPSIIYSYQNRKSHKTKNIIFPLKPKKKFAAKTRKSYFAVKTKKSHISAKTVNRIFPSN